MSAGTMEPEPGSTTHPLFLCYLVQPMFWSVFPQEMERIPSISVVWWPPKKYRMCLYRCVYTSAFCRTLRLPGSVVVKTSLTRDQVMTKTEVYQDKDEKQTLRGQDQDQGRARLNQSAQRFCVLWVLNSRSVKLRYWLHLIQGVLNLIASPATAVVLTGLDIQPWVLQIRDRDKTKYKCSRFRDQDI